MATAATAAAVRDEERRVVLAGERDRLRRRPGERERERERVWKPATLWRVKKQKGQDQHGQAGASRWLPS